MDFSLLTYNVLFNKACTQLQSLFLTEEPDVVCLQEVETNDKNIKKFENMPYKLADYSNSFIKFGNIYGVATFYNPKKVHFLESSLIELPQSLYEVLLILLRGTNKPRTVLKTEFIHKQSQKKITIYNLHLTTWSTNGARIKQLKETLSDIEISSHTPVIIAGDFNYPYGRRKFEDLIKQYHLQEATNNIFFTLESKVLKIIPIKMKLDYILYNNLQPVETRKISLRYSDHFPIISRFSL